MIDGPSDEEIAEILEAIEEQQANWDPLDLPESQAQLARDIHSAGGPKVLIVRVGAGLYHDYVSPHPSPKHLLVSDAKAHGLEEIAYRAKRGVYDP